MSGGSLIICGTGIKLVGHVTLETRTLIEGSQTVLYLVSDPGTGAWIRTINPRAESLEPYFAAGRTRWDSFQLIIERILAEVSAGRQVCVVFYGHPGVFVYMSHEAIRRARAMGREAAMLPGISAEDCLMADLGVDLSVSGYQCFEAMQFLVQRRRPDPASALILWQIGVIGQFQYDFVGSPEEGLRLLTDALLEHYPPAHEVTIYEAANFPLCDPRADRTPLCDLPRSRVTRISTLYVPPSVAPTSDQQVMRKLGLLPPAASA